MASLKIDIVDGAKLSMEGLYWTLSRMAHVTGLTDTTDYSIYRAATAPGMPVYNDAHPSIPNLFCRKLHPTPTGPTSCRIEIVYQSYIDGLPVGTLMEVGTTAAQISTQKGLDGSKLLVAYTNSDGVALPKEVAQVQVYAQKTSYSFTRAEYGSPDAKALAYVRRTNSQTWNGKPPGTVFCFGINGRSQDGFLYATTYTLEYDPLGWDPEAGYHDESGRVPMDVADPPIPTPIPYTANGYRRFLYYPPVDFNPLGLVIV